jgi:hypothetical protein
MSPSACVPKYILKSVHALCICAAFKSFAYLTVVKLLFIFMKLLNNTKGLFSNPLQVSAGALQVAISTM